MISITVPHAIVPSAFLQFTKQMELLQAQVAQQQLAINKAIQPLAMSKNVQQQIAQFTRAHVFLVEQYQKSARAKQKRAHAHLVAICQSVAGKLRKFVSLREVAAQFYKHTTADMRTTLHELLSTQHQANAPNCAPSFVMHSHLEVAATT